METATADVETKTQKSTKKQDNADALMASSLPSKAANHAEKQSTDAGVVTKLIHQ